jgi:hypothetical protein
LIASWRDGAEIYIDVKQLANIIRRSIADLVQFKSRKSNVERKQKPKLAERRHLPGRWLVDASLNYACVVDSKDVAAQHGRASRCNQLGASGMKESLETFWDGIWRSAEIGLSHRRWVLC